MKRTEQDRGRSLIAVPRITDDFHAIALNDYPGRLQPTPSFCAAAAGSMFQITYRNGRRALLTLEKGPAGTGAFTKSARARTGKTGPEPVKRFCRAPGLPLLL